MICDQCKLKKKEHLDQNIWILDLLYRNFEDIFDPSAFLDVKLMSAPIWIVDLKKKQNRNYSRADNFSNIDMESIDILYLLELGKSTWLKII